MKRCSRCLQEKPIADFYKGKAACKSCFLAGLVEYRQRPEVREQRQRNAQEYQQRPEIRRRHREHAAARMRTASGKASHRRAVRKYKYGVTDDDHALMLSVQGGRCAGCSRPFNDDRRDCVDHDHATGRVRGLLCRDCNLALGSVGDDPAVLRALAAYLERNT